MSITSDDTNDDSFCEFCDEKKAGIMDAYVCLNCENIEDAECVGCGELFTDGEGNLLFNHMCDDCTESYDWDAPYEE